MDPFLFHISGKNLIGGMQVNGQLNNSLFLWGTFTQGPCRLFFLLESQRNVAFCSFTKLESWPRLEDEGNMKYMANPSRKWIFGLNSQK